MTAVNMGLTCQVHTKKSYYPNSREASQEGFLDTVTEDTDTHNVSAKKPEKNGFAMSQQELMSELASHQDALKDRLEHPMKYADEKSVSIGGAELTDEEWDKMLSRVDLLLEDAKDEADQHSRNTTEQMKEGSEEQSLLFGEKGAVDKTGGNSVIELSNGVSILHHNKESKPLEKLMYGSDSLDAKAGGVDVTRESQEKVKERFSGKNKYFHQATNGYVEHNGVIFKCNYQTSALELGDCSKKDQCLRIPLSSGGSLMVNPDSLGSLSKAIDMFDPEDQYLILQAIELYKMAKDKENELEDAVNGDHIEQAEDVKVEQAEKMKIEKDETAD